MITLNKPGYITHFPCPDTPANKLMAHANFESQDPAVYWAGSPSPDLDFEGSLSDPSTIFPRANEVVRIPRCLRIALSVTNSDIGYDHYIVPFVIEIKDWVKSLNKSIYFQHNLEGGGGILNNACVPWNADFNSFDGGATYPDLDVNYFNDNCLFGTDVLTFGIGSQSAASVSVKTDMSGAPVSATDGWPTIVEYFNTQYDIFSKFRVIFQAGHLNQTLFPGATDTGDNHNNTFLFDNLATQSMGFTRPKGWEVGPSFNFDLGYIKDTVVAHWEL